MLAPSRLRRGGRPRAIVIGSGLGGLAAAVRLLAADVEVTVLEAGAAPGGRAGQIRERGFTFDTGPSLITMPELLDDLFRLAGTATERQLHLRPLDPFYGISWQGEPRSFLFGADHDRMLDQIARFSAGDATRYDDFLQASRRIYDEAILVAGRRSFLKLRGFAALIPSMLRLGALRSVDGFVGRFFREPHVRQAFAFHSLFIGGDPFRVPAVYAALAYLQIAGGVWYADGGMYSLVQRLADIVRGGGELITDCPVHEIVHDGTSVSGVRTEAGDLLGADYVISNADVVATRRMLGRVRGEPRLTMSCYLLYLGCRRSFPQLHHHTLLVGSDYRGFIRSVTETGPPSESMSLYVHAPSRTEPEMAQSGGESITVLLPVPNLRRHDWTGEAVREKVLGMLESDQGLGLHGLRESIVVERAWTPLDFRDQLGAVAGNAFGPEPTLLQSAYFRQPNRDRHLHGMYYVGAGTHPGAGVPGVLLGAEVTTNLLLEEIRQWR